jgi:serine/threonine-protein kinase HipA
MAAHIVDVTSVQSADVYKGEALAAQLKRTPDGTQFRYIDDYLTGGGPSVATTLPLTDEPLIRSAGALPPFFAGLLPEGRRLSSLRRKVKTSADDELSMLLVVGGDTVGDVRVVPHGADLQSPNALVEVKREFSEIRFSDVLDDAGIVDPIAIAGVQDKASARVISVPISSRGRRYILKVDPPEYPLIVQNEDYFLRLARKARFPVVRAKVVNDSTGRAGLLVERFDRVGQPDGSTINLAVEDAAQVLGIYPADKYNVTSERVAEALSHWCSASPVALRDIYHQFCFAWLTGNGDLHAKNLSILQKEGEWRVAPTYDVPTTLPYGDTTAALSIGGRKQGLSRRRLLEFGDAIGLPAAAAVSVLDKVIDAVEPVENDWRSAVVPFPNQTLHTVSGSLRRRLRDASTT